MNRRSLLTTAAVAVFGSFAGCSGTGDGSAGTNESSAMATETPTESTGPTTTARTTARATGDTETGTPQPTRTAGPGTPDGSVRTTEVQTETTGVPTTAPTASTTERTGTTDTATPDSSSTREEADGARVAFEEGQVVVTGTILAKNGCQEATLASVRSKGTELVVTVGTERSAGTNAMCTQALTPVEYRFTLTPDTAPESVTVIHATMEERRTITTEERT